MIEGLNIEQSQAAKAIYGPVMVFAGAGSGKTRTLTYRIINMIMNEHISPYNILAITFTNKATNEMKERIASYIDVDSRNITISTFHSLCARILRKEIEVLGYGRDFTIIDDEDQLKILGEIVKDLNEDKKTAKSYQKEINYCKCFNLMPEDPRKIKVYEEYEKRMKSFNLLDFEDLLIKVYDLFTKFPDVLHKYQERYQYILVDEFQDTNLIQYKIIKLIALKYQNIFVVGDDDQSIYSFRGTNYENINLFQRDFPLCQKFTLVQNYRSTQTILEHSNRLISRNVYREKKELFSEKTGSTDDVVLYQANDERDEVEYVIQKVLELKSAQNSFSDFAILYRSSTILRNYELGMIRHQIPYKVFGGLSYLRRREVKDIISYFKLLINDNDIISFKRVINTPSRGIGNSTLEKLEMFRKVNGYDIFTAIERSQKHFTTSKYGQLKSFKDMIFKYRDRLNDVDLITIFDEMLIETGYLDYLRDEADSDEDYKDRFANLNEFKSILWNVENSGEAYLSRTERLRDAFDSALLSDEYLQNQKENPNGLTLSTIHSVKGLEYRYVFLVGFEENIFPSAFRLLNLNELEEERRIAYVAMTRAKEKLFLTCAERRLIYGTLVKNGPSRFMLESVGAETIKTRGYEEAVVIQEKIQKVTLENKDKDKEHEGYIVSDKIIHKAFGEGIILEINNGIASIFFNEEKKMRKILLDHPAIQKLK